MNGNIPRTLVPNNRIQSLLLLSAMILLMAFMGYIISGTPGAIWAILLSIAVLYFMPRVAPGMMMRLYKAKPIHPSQAPALYEVVRDIAKQSNLPTVPVLYYIPSSIMNAFTVGNKNSAAIAVTHGLINTLSFRELSGVLAHEVSHILHDDVRVMTLADITGRMTYLFSLVGKILLFINLPLLFTGQATISWFLVLALIFAPSVSLGLQLALSRSREYDADIKAASLTRDPLGLASALGKIEQRSVSMWERILLPGRKEKQPSFLRTHPATEERISRLVEISKQPGMQQPRYNLREGALHSGLFANRIRKPRMRWGGFWF